MKVTCPTCDGPPSDADVLAYRCSRCGAGLESTAHRSVESFESAILRDRGPVWRYERLLPLGSDAILDDPLPAGPARSRALEERTAAAEVWLVDATTLGTGTFKDYEAAVIVAMAGELGVEQASVHSTGNTALAYLHYARRAGSSCAAYVPADNLSKLGAYKSTADLPVIAVDADYAHVSSLAKADAAASGRTHLAPTPWKLEGKAAIGYAIREFCPDVDVIVQTVAGGYGPLGFEVAFRRLREIGETRGVAGRRRYALYQAGDSATLARAWAEGLDELSGGDLQLPERPFEPTLQSTNPLATLPELRRCLPGGSTITPVPTDEVDAAADLVTSILGENGIRIDYAREKSAVISIAGVLASRWASTDRIAIVVSGSAPFTAPGHATIERTIGAR